MHNLNMIVAMNKKYVIGDKGKIPWYIPEELKHFKETTRYGVLIMGSKTYKSVEKFLPFEDRDIIVLSSGEKTEFPHAMEVFKDIKSVLDHVYSNPERTFWVSGGLGVYDALIPYCGRWVMSKVDDDSDGDTNIKSILEKNLEFEHKDNKRLIISSETKHEKFIVYDIIESYEH